MAISIRAAVKNILSDRYNKTNVTYYALLCVILCVFSMLPRIVKPEINENWILFFIFSLILSIVFGILLCGIYAIAINNGYRRELSVFPSIINDFKKSFVSGLKMFAGFMVMYIASIFILWIPVAFVIIGITGISHLVSDSRISVAIFLVIAVIFALLVLFIILLFLGLFLNFYKTLEIEDLLNVVKSWKFISRIRKPLSSFILRFIVLGIIFSVTFLLLCLIFGILITIPASINNTSLNDVKYGTIAAVIYGILYPVYYLIYIDLTIQLLQESDEYLPDEMKTEPEEEFDEYLEEDSDDDNDDYTDND